MKWTIGKGISPFIGNRGGTSWSSYCTPLNIDVVQITGGNRITWTQDAKCTDEDGFEIWVSINGGAYALLDTVLADVLLYDDTTDYAGNQVTYKVRAYKGTTYSNFTDESEIVIEPDITNLAVAWAEDHAVVTFDGTAGWETELETSRDNITYSLVTTIVAGTETYTDHTWQGITVYYRARAKKVLEYGDYCTAVNIVTPLVFKYDNDPYAALSIGGLGLPAGKTVRFSWGTFTGGAERYTDYTLNTAIQHDYNIADEPGDPRYVKISGDINSITTLVISSNVRCYGDLSKWILPTGLTQLYLNICAFTGDISGWGTLPSGLVNFRIYRNGFTGDLSSWIISTSASTIIYLEDTDGKNEFTGIPRGNCHQCENATAGLYMLRCAVATAGVDAWLAWFNTFLVTNTPVRNSLFQISGTGMGIPTGGNANANRLGIIAKYVAAGFTATITNNT